MKKLPTSVENFEKLIKGNYYYVDKSMLIKDIVTLSGEIKLITRPRRFGKTLNMDMMLHFFSMDEEDSLFENLKIWNEKGIVQEHYHKYPVIYISFKSIKEQSWQEARNSIVELISELAQKYIDLNVPNITKEKIILLAKREADLSLYKKSLQLFSQALYEERGIMPVILIDEYDVPIESAYLNKHKDPAYYDNMIDFMRAFLTSALKGSDTYFSFAVLTGVYRIAKESIFSGLNNLAVYSVFDSGMTDKYGFTESEVKEMLRHYSLPEKDMLILKEWYGGFKFSSDVELFNPWSVINYIASRVEVKNPPDRAAQPYWINTSSNDIIKEQIIKNPAVKETLDQLIEGKEVLQILDPWLSLRELEEATEGVWTLFVSSGYLVARYYEEDSYYIKIPNREIKKFFQKTVNRWLAKALRMHEMPNVYIKLKEMLTEGKAGGFKEFMEDFIVNVLSYHDLGFKEKEKVYKALLLGILSVAINGYVVESEIESGYGRLDMVVYPKSKEYGKYAAIFEVKRADKEENLEKFSKEALNQIKEREYYSKMQKLGYKVIGFGIAFCGKHVKIEVESL